MPVTARAGRGVVLTEAGRVLARHAETVVHAIDQAADELDDLRGLRAGTVRVAAFPSASSTVVPRLLGGLAAAHPGLGFGYLEAEPPEAVAAVRAREADVAVTFAYPDDPDDPGARSLDGLESRPLWRETLWAVLPESRALRHRGPLALHDLAADRWIAGCVRCRRHLVSACARSGFAPATSFETDNAAAAVGMVQAGLGVALLPSLALATAPLPAASSAGGSPASASAWSTSSRRRADPPPRRARRRRGARPAARRRLGAPPGVSVLPAHGPAREPSLAERRRSSVMSDGSASGVHRGHPDAEER